MWQDWNVIPDSALFQLHCAAKKSFKDHTSYTLVIETRLTFQVQSQMSWLTVQLSLSPLPPQEW